MEKRKITPAIVVEGKYDKIRLDSFLDATIVVTDGFRIYKRPDMLKLLRHYANTIGLVILTDADAAGFQIRGYLKGAIPDGRLYHVYVPNIHGKERRKTAPSAEGTLGVEGLDHKILLDALERAGVFDVTTPCTLPCDITPAVLYEHGLNGAPNSNLRRQLLLKKLGLSNHLSVSALCDVLCTMTSAEKLSGFLAEYLPEEEL
ncbi:MAG: DUF4093 domain-containing protein [Oscillospiraceae bacterium]|nr:DUF4093 domain-containing protein [Oscillospiraceae bacterium]